MENEEVLEFDGRLMMKYPEKNRPERIRKYVTEEAYEDLDSSVDTETNLFTYSKGNMCKVDRELQIYYVLLHLVEAALSQKELESSYFKKSLDNPRHKSALEGLRNNSSDWYKKLQTDMTKDPRNDEIYLVLSEGKFIFPYLAFYCVDNGISPYSAFSNLLKNDALYVQFIDEVAGMKDYTISKIAKVFSEKVYYDSFQKDLRINNYDHIREDGYFFFRIYKDGHRDDSPQTCDTFKYVIGGENNRPYNSILLDNEDEKLNGGNLVFVTEFIHAAKVLEDRIINNYVEFIKKQIWYIEGDKSKIDITPNYNAPVGDCVWISPVGGYAVPWCTDWRVLNDKCVYIFKVGEENPKVYLKELADVLDAIHRQLDEYQVRINFVIFPRKESAKYKENEISILSVEEFFIQCKKNKIHIPETLRGYYGRIIRRHTSARADEFIVEPILRKNDWILFSGEEGTGKSTFAIGMGMAISSSTSKMMFTDWKKHRKPLKVLYITDYEMSETILNQTFTTFRQIYNLRDNGLFFYERVNDYDLTTTEYQDKVEKMIDNYASIGKENEPVSVVILDHLLKLTAAKGDKEDRWPIFRKWLDKLTGKNLSIILIHHEYGGDRMLGTRLISNDIGTRVHFEDYYKYIQHRWENMPKKRDGKLQKQYDELYSSLTKLKEFEKEKKGTNLGIRIVKNRGGLKDRELRYLGLERDKPSWHESIGDEPQASKTSETVNWKMMSDEDKDRIIIELYEKGTKTQVMADMIGKCKSIIEQRVTALGRAGRLTLRKKHPKTTEKVEDTNADSQTVKTDN